MTKKLTGLDKCQQAFERLKAGAPHVSKYVGINKADISPSVVSIESGQDKGYLKSSRPQHKELIAQIKALAEGAQDGSNRGYEKLSRKHQRVTGNYQEQALVLEKVLSQNLMLVERVRELEAELQRQGVRPTVSWKVAQSLGLRMSVREIDKESETVNDSGQA